MARGRVKKNKDITDNWAKLQLTNDQIESKKMKKTKNWLLFHIENS